MIVRKFPILIPAFLLGMGVVFGACGGKSGSDLTGNWNVKSATADTSIHSEPGLSSVVFASTLAEGATMAFANDSLTITMPPDGNQHQIAYSSTGSLLILHTKSGHLDTLSYSLSGDTLKLNNPRTKVAIVLSRGAVQ